MIGVKTGIAIISLSDTFKKLVAKNLADKLDMNFVDVNEFVQYDVLNIDHIIKTAGLEYYNNLERKSLKVLSSYENTVMSLDLPTLLNEFNYKYLKEKTIICFVKIDIDELKRRLTEIGEYHNTFADKIFEKVFNEREKIVEQVSEVVVEVKSNTKSVEDCLIEEIKKYFEAKNERK